LGLDVGTSTLERRIGWLVLLIGIVGFAWQALRLGQDINSDLFNYHFYNPFAFFNSRIGHDIAPAGFQTYLSPVGDFPLYIFTKFVGLNGCALLLGALQGLSLFFLYFTGLELFKRQEINDRVVLAVSCSLCGLLGPMQISEIGSSVNDALLSVPIVVGTYLFIRTPLIPRRFLRAGFFYGVGAGLKLIFAPYLLGAFFVGLWRSKSNFKLIVQFGISFIVGYLFINGFWTVILMRHFHSPIFPLYNTLFHSPYFVNADFHDDRWIPKSLFEIFKLPWDIGNGAAKNIELGYRDVRYCVLVVFVLLYWIKRWISYISFRQIQQATSFTWLSLFFLISACVWFKAFGYQRYAIPLEMFAPFLTGYCIQELFPGRLKTLGINLNTALMVMIISAVHAPEWGHVGWGSKLCELSSEQYRRFENATVLVSNAQPYSFVIPSFPASTKFIDVDNGLIGHKNLLAFKSDVEKAVSGNGPFFQLINDVIPPIENPPFSPRDVTACEYIKTIVYKIRLCKFVDRPVINMD
jgi:hypothetical protein